MRGLARRCGLSGGNHASLHIRRKRWNARTAGLVAQQTRHALREEPLLPSPDRGLAGAGAASEFHGAAAIGGQQHDLRPPYVLLRTVAVGDDAAQRLTIGFGEVNLDGLAHPPDSHDQGAEGILSRMQASDYIH